MDSTTVRTRKKTLSFQEFIFKGLEDEGKRRLVLLIAANNLLSGSGESSKKNLVKGKMDMQTVLAHRTQERIKVNIETKYGTILEERQGVICDLTDTGACISGKPFNEGDRIHLEVDGQLVWGKVRWTEIDRMGIAFTTPISEVLRSRLAIARRSAYLASARKLGVGFHANDNRASAKFAFGRKAGG